jgi:hypothetical protein
MGRICLTSSLFFGLTITSYAQEFYTPVTHGMMYTPLQGDDPHLFNLNPATNNTTGFKTGAYGLRHFRETTFTDNDDSKTETKGIAKEEAYGGGLLMDLGAGTAAGFNADRSFTTDEITRSSSNGKRNERMYQQSVMARVQVELATGLRVGLALRYVSLSGDVLGSFNSNNDRDRVRYHGNLLGNGGGIQYTNGAVRLGSAYFPASRGKSEILFEERIISDPGMALVDASYNTGSAVVAAGIQRWVHRRDERAANVDSIDQQRNLRLDGLDWERHVLPTTAYHLGVEVKAQSNLFVRASAAKKYSVFIMDNTTSPTTFNDYENTNELDYHLGVRYISGNYDILAGGSSWRREKKLTDKSGEPGATYKASGTILYLSLSAKL